MATFLYLTRVLFFAVHTRKRQRFTLECHNPMLFLLPDTPHRIYSHSQSSTVLLRIIFFTKGYQAYMYFLYLFLSFNKHLYQLLNFTFSCTLTAFINGLFFAWRVTEIKVLLLATYKTYRLLFPFSCVSQNSSKCNEFSMASCGFTFRIVVVSLEKEN